MKRNVRTSELRRFAFCVSRDIRAPRTGEAVSSVVSLWSPPELALDALLSPSSPSLIVVRNFGDPDPPDSTVGEAVSKLVFTGHANSASATSAARSISLSCRRKGRQGGQQLSKETSTVASTFVNCRTALPKERKSWFGTSLRACKHDTCLCLQARDAA